MAQIMKYHNWPPKGKGQKMWDPPYDCEYECSGYDSETRNFGARSYNWDSMPLHNANSAIALTMRDIGHAVKMNYTPSGSGANMSDAVYAFETYFRYDQSAYLAWKSSYSTVTWINTLKAEVDAGRPICYRGQNAGGHAFVCDGYDAPDHFHFNWGWGGSYDGYFYLNDLTPGSYDFTSSQGGIFDLKPVRVPILTTAAISSITPTSAVSGGNITDENCSPVTARGVCWNTTGNPTIGDDKNTDGSGTGSYTSMMTGLTPNTTYYVRAYAVNLSGTGYGNEVSFTTNANVCKGDFDDDGDVDGSDLAVFAADFGRTDCGTGDPCEGDFDVDGDVDGSDLAVFAADFGRTDCLD